MLRDHAQLVQEVSDMHGTCNATVSSACISRAWGVQCMHIACMGCPVHAYRVHGVSSACISRAWGVQLHA
jgi:hypothetical protein